MRTNMEKWVYWDDILKSKESEFIKSTATDIPTVLYSVSPNGMIIEKIITGVSYYNPIYFSFNKRPTKDQVERLRRIAEDREPLLVERIHLNYVEKHSRYSSSGAVKMPDLNKYLSKGDAERISGEIKEKIAQEEILLQNGHARCQRCTKVVPDNKLITTKIISIATYGYAGRIMKFCSSTCADHEQWAHEG